MRARKEENPSGAQTRKWVVFRLSSLGDVVLTTGVIEFLNHEYGLEISVITRESLAPVFTGNPRVKKVHGISTDNLKNRSWWKISTELAGEFPDHGLLDLHGTMRSRILKWIWPGPCLLYPKMNLKRRRYRYLRDSRARQDLLKRNVPQRYCAAISTPPMQEELRPRIYLQKKEIEQAEYTLDKLGVSRPFVCIHPYATHRAKTWPRENWLAFVRLLEEKLIDYIVIGREEKPLLKNAPCDLTNKTSLRETCALLGASSHLITPDSGPMHLGSALNTPVTALFGPTSREWGFFPSGEKDMPIHLGLACSPCTLHGKTLCRRGLACMRGITPEMVLEAMQSRLGSTSS
jgi:ADP-heptose:LPS heptosyltransferase